MTTKANTKRSSAGAGTRVKYTFDRNGAFVVDPYSLLTNKTVRAQISAAVKLGQAQSEAKLVDKKK